MSLRMLCCEEMTAFLDAYLSGHLSDEVRAAFERHLEVCEACVRFLDQYRRSFALGRAALEGEAVDVMPDDLVEVILRSVDEDGPQPS